MSNGFDDFLKEDNIYEEVKSRAIKRVALYQRKRKTIDNLEDNRSFSINNLFTIKPYNTIKSISKKPNIIIGLKLN